MSGEFRGQRSLAAYSAWGHKSWTRLSLTLSSETQGDEMRVSWQKHQQRQRVGVQRGRSRGGLGRKQGTPKKLGFYLGSL